MNKDKEVEVVDCREAEVDLKKLCKIKETMNGRMMKN